jgi:hypothetical protein
MDCQTTGILMLANLTLFTPTSARLTFCEPAMLTGDVILMRHPNMHQRRTFCRAGFDSTDAQTPALRNRPESVQMWDPGIPTIPHVKKN